MRNVLFTVSVNPFSNVLLRRVDEFHIGSQFLHDILHDYSRRAGTVLSSVAVPRLCGRPAMLRRHASAKHQLNEHPSSRISASILKVQATNEGLMPRHHSNSSLKTMPSCASTPIHIVAGQTGLPAS